MKGAHLRSLTVRGPFSTTHRLDRKLAQQGSNAGDRFLERLPAQSRAIVERQAGGALATAPLSSAPLPVVPRPHAPAAQPIGARGTNKSCTISSYPAEPSGRSERRAATRVQRKHDRRARLGCADHLARHRRRVEKMLDGHRARMAERRGAEPVCPPSLRLDDWRFADACWYDSTGRTAIAGLKSLPPVWAGAIRRAALGEVDGECTRKFDSERARAIVILGVALCSNAIATRRKGKRCHIVRGFTIGAFQTLCRGGRARPLHRNTVKGYHDLEATELVAGPNGLRRRTKPSHAHTSMIGYLDALEAAGLFYAQQVPPHEAEPWEIWKVKRKRKGSAELAEIEVTSNRYWLVNPNPFDGHLTAEVRTCLLQLADSALSSAALRLRPRARRPSSAAPALAASQGPPAPD